MSDQQGYSLACRNCGATLDRDDNFCRNCGTRILKPAHPPDLGDQPTEESHEEVAPDTQETQRHEAVPPETSPEPQPERDEQQAFEYQAPAPEDTREERLDAASEPAPGPYPHVEEPAAPSQPQSTTSQISETLTRTGIDRTWWIIGAIIVLLIITCCCLGLAIAGLAASDSAFQQELRSATVSFTIL